METKANRAFELKELSEKGEFEGFVSVYGNVDHGNDIVEKGAFKDIRLTNKGRLRILLEHKGSQPVGTAEVIDTDEGLFLKGKINKNLMHGPQAYELLKEGMIGEMSVGFSVKDGGFETKRDSSGQMIRHITNAELYEGSLVQFAMNPQAVITSVKSEDEANLKRLLQKHYRSLGCSKRDSAERVSKFFNSHDGRDARSESTGAMLDSYKSLSILLNN